MRNDFCVFVELQTRQIVLPAGSGCLSRSRFCGAKCCDLYSVLALIGENVLPFSPVSFLYLPWDFVLILLFLGIFVPWRGAERMQRLRNKPELASADRLSLYVSTILFQWLMVGFVTWRVLSRSVSVQELGLAANDPWRVAWVSLVLAGVLCLNQVVGVRRIVNMPEGQRGTLFAITKNIIPRGPAERWVYTALSCTAGISEEFLYRGFVFMAFVRVFVNYGPPNLPAAVFSSAWFSLGHIYQGPRGMVTTFIVGMIFASVRIWTGSLIPSAFAHLCIDLVLGIYTSMCIGQS